MGRRIGQGGEVRCHGSPASVHSGCVPDGRKTADEFILSRQLADVTGYDIALVDCPPSLGLLTLNALTAASRLVVVTEASFLALQGTAELLETLELVRTHYNHHARAFLSDESGRGPHPG